MIYVAERIRGIMDTLAGGRDLPEQVSGTMAGQMVLGIWWFVLLCAFLAFAGRSMRFVYVDF